jgi:signal transduction histidine kinase
MRVLIGAAGVLSLIVLLTWLTLRGIDTNATTYTMALKAYDDYELAEASLHRDVLQARAGLLRDYDPLVQSSKAMESAATRLRSYAQTEGLDMSPLNRLAEAAAKEEELTERFKRENALLQNSLTYASLVSTSPEFGTGNAKFGSSASALAAAILQLTRNTSPESVQALRRRINEFAGQSLPIAPEAEAVKALRAHARLLADLLPASDETLKSLIAAPSRQALDETRALFAQFQTTLEEAARRFRLLLYFTSLALLAMLVRLILRLRTRALERQRRAALEHVIAENSTRLISSPPAETEARLSQVLGELCQALGAERAYAVLDEAPARAITASANGSTYPPGWPAQALKLYEELSVTAPIIKIYDTAGLPAGAAKETLAAAGVCSWACVPLILPRGIKGIMGFDAFQPTGDRIFPLSVMRLAGDAVANAIAREHLEQERARLSAHLERARRMQFIGSLASGVAHNFNNIIGAVLGYAEMTKPLLTPGSKPAKHIEEIQQAAERGRDLIDNILTFGRRHEANVRQVQVPRLIEEAASLLRVSLPSGIELLIEEVPAGVTVWGEPAQLQQVLLNLCTNAMQSIESRGTIRVITEKKELIAPLTLSHGALAAGKYLCLVVTDTGRGIDETVARRLFQPFFTTRAGGTGLGLATVREIVHEHHGALNVKSEIGRGSRFEVWLPIAAAESSPPPSLRLGRGQTVMIVECQRERLLRDEEMLAALGYEPAGFERPGDAIAACRSEPGRFDVFLVSLVPGTDVLSLTRELHKIAPALPLLLAAEPTSEVTAGALADAGVSEIVQRPLMSDELAAALARCLRSPRSEEVFETAS